MGAVRREVEVERPVAEPRPAPLPRQSDPPGESCRVGTAVAGVVDEHRAAAPGEEGVEARGPRRRPLAALE
jgi:hypothetical protein